MMMLSPLSIRPAGMVTELLEVRAVMPLPRLQSTRTTLSEPRVNWDTRWLSGAAEKGFMIRSPMAKMSSTWLRVTRSVWDTRSATMAETWPMRFWAI